MRLCRFDGGRGAVARRGGQGRLLGTGCSRVDISSIAARRTSTATDSTSIARVTASTNPRSSNLAISSGLGNSIDSNIYATLGRRTDRLRSHRQRRLRPVWPARLTSGHEHPLRMIDLRPGNENTARVNSGRGNRRSARPCCRRGRSAVTNAHPCWPQQPHQAQDHAASTRRCGRPNPEQRS
jgi:hypothetical protein